MSDSDKRIAEAKKMLSDDRLSPQEYAERILEIQSMASGVSRVDDDEKRRLQRVFATAMRETSNQKTTPQLKLSPSTRAPLVTAIGACLLSIVMFQWWAPTSERLPVEPSQEIERHDSPIVASPKAKAVAPIVEEQSTDKDTGALELFEQAQSAANQYKFNKSKLLLMELAEEFPCSTVRREAGDSLASQLSILNQAVPTRFFTDIDWLTRDTNARQFQEGGVFILFWELWCPYCLETSRAPNDR